MMSSAEAQAPDGLAARGTAESEAPAAPPTTPESAAAILLELALREAPAPVAGAPLSLASLLEAAQDRTERRQLIENYWDLSLALAADHFAQDERDRLRNSVDNEHEPAWTAVLARAEVSVREARTRVIDAQHRLAILRGQELQQPLPISSELPVTGEYRTYYDELFTQTGAPREDRLSARRLDATLPLAQSIVTARANSVVAAQRWLARVETEWQAGNSSRQELVRAWQNVVNERRAWLDSVRKYNQLIADYALLAAQDDSNPLRLVAMLSYATLQSAGDVVPVSGEEAERAPEPAEQPASAAVETPPATSNNSLLDRARANSRDTAREQPTRPRQFSQPKGELRSILVPSRGAAAGR